MVTTCWLHCTYFQALTASVKPWFLCDTPSAFLLPGLPSSHEHTFSTYESNLCCHFSRFCFVSLFSWHFCGNNEAEGTCFLQVPTAVYSHYQLTTRVWGSLALPGGEGVNCGGAADSCWTLPPSVTPLLPAPWWVVASWAHCLRSADKRWKFDGTFQTSFPLLRYKKRETYDI